MAPQSPSPVPVVPTAALLVPDILLDPAGTLGNIGTSSSNWSYDLVLDRDGPAELVGCSVPIEKICSTVFYTDRQRNSLGHGMAESEPWGKVTYLDIEPVLSE